MKIQVNQLITKRYGVKRFEFANTMINMIESLILNEFGSVMRSTFIFKNILTNIIRGSGEVKIPRLVIIRLLHPCR